jgi:ferredoxin
MVVYFTGTGNSRYCARLLADALQDKWVDVFPFLREGKAAALESQTPWVFVSPTYAWQLPRVFADWIRKSSFSGSREAYFVMTCGGETGDAQRGLAALCKEKNFVDRGLLPVVLPDNYLVMFPAPKPGEAEEKLAAAKPRLLEAARRIQAGQAFDPLPTGLLARLKSGPINAGMYRFYIRPSRFYATDACVSCGQCAAACPLGNIRLAEGRPVWGEKCTHCMACLCGCPTGAIEYGKATRGKTRYQCPPYRGMD